MSGSTSIEPSGPYLGEDVGAGAEVDDVEDLDVLAQLLVGELEALAHLLALDPSPLAAGLDEDRRQRDDTREALRADGRLAAPLALVGRLHGAWSLAGVGQLVGQVRVAGVPGLEQLDALDQLVHELHGPTSWARSPMPSTQETSWRGFARA